MTKILHPFKYRGKWDHLLVTVFLFINGLVAVNAVLHDPYVGYDIRDHLNMIRVLSEEHHWPTAEQSREFYSPPIPYLLPALFKDLLGTNLLRAAKFGQLVNLFLSIGVTYLLLKISDLVLEESRYLKIASLIFLGMMAVYYRTFAFIRGENYLTFFAVLVIYQTLHIFLREHYDFHQIITLGLELSLMPLSRQWGLLIFPAILLFVTFLTVKDGMDWRRRLKVITISYAIALILSGWFYLFLKIQNGSALAFSTKPVQFSLSTQPPEFYFGTGSGKLFSDPIRPSFANQLFPTFYSDTWGDYLGYFLVYGRNLQTHEYIFGEKLLNLTNQAITESSIETNRFSIASYLGRVNLLDLIPSAFLLSGWLLGIFNIWRGLRQTTLGYLDSMLILLSLIVACTLGGYMWFLIRYPDYQGSAIKATYMMQIFPCLALGAGTVIEKLRKKYPKIWIPFLIVFGIIMLHDVPTMLTHFPLFHI